MTVAEMAFCQSFSVLPKNKNKIIFHIHRTARTLVVTFSL